MKFRDSLNFVSMEDFFSQKLNIINNEREDLHIKFNRELSELRKVICLVYYFFLKIVKLKFKDDYDILEASYRERKKISNIYRFTNYNEAPF